MWICNSNKEWKTNPIPEILIRLGKQVSIGQTSGICFHSFIHIMEDSFLDYDIDERETSIDNMCDSLMTALQRNADKSHFENVTAIYEEFVVNGRDPLDGEYEFLYIENLAI